MPSISPRPKLSFLFPFSPLPQIYMFKNNFSFFICFSSPHLFSINRAICLKPGSLNLHPTHLLKSQLVLEEVDDVLRRFMSPSEGTRGENQGSIYYRALLPQIFVEKGADGLTTSWYTTSPLLFGSAFLPLPNQDRLDFYYCWRLPPLSSVPEPQIIRICDFSWIVALF